MCDLFFYFDFYSKSNQFSCRMTYHFPNRIFVSKMNRKYMQIATTEPIYEELESFYLITNVFRFINVNNAFLFKYWSIDYYHTPRMIFSFLFGTESKIRQMEWKKRFGILVWTKMNMSMHTKQFILKRWVYYPFFFQMLTTNQDKFQRKMNESLAKSIKKIEYEEYGLNTRACKDLCYF